MRKTILFVGVLLFCSFVLGLPGVLASEDYPLGCCLGPFAPADLTATSEDDCTSAQVWFADCYAQTGGIISLNPLIDSDDDDVETTCCCYQNSDEFTDEAKSAEKNSSDVLKAYCDALTEDGADYTSKPLDSQTSCEAVCSQNNLPGLEVSGYVYEEENNKGLSDINVILEYTDGITYNTTTNNGLYSFKDVPSGTATFYLSTPALHPYDCPKLTSNEKSITATNNEFNFTLTCEQKTTTCTPDWNISEWSECFVYAGSQVQTRTITDENNCGLPLPNETTRLCPGSPITTGVCGDGILNAGEQCDTGEGTSSFLAHNGTVLTSNFSCARVLGQDYATTQDVACTSQCTYDLSACTAACGNTCDSVDKCRCDICTNTEAGRALCSQDCLITPPQFLSPTNDYISNDDRSIYHLYDSVIGEDEHIDTALYPGIYYELYTADVTLTWNYNASCDDYLLGFKAYACEEQESSTSCKPNTLQSVTITSKSDRTQTFSNLLEKEKTSYCYNVCAVTLDGKEHCAYESNELPCFLSGDAPCMESGEREGYYCKAIDGKTQPVGCNQGGENGYTDDAFGILSNLQLETHSCKDNEMCVETQDEPGAVCKAVSECDQCNGLFGLYANYNLPIIIEDQSIYCNDIQFYGAQERASKKIARGAEDYIGRCYKDVTPSSLPAFGSCDAVQSCYDYVGERACENDPCMKFQDASQACEWTSYDEELGIGICAPQQEEQVECGRCDIESPTGFCTETMCQDIYGKGIKEDVDAVCYYNEHALATAEKSGLLSVLYRSETSPRVPTCIHKENTACSFYDTKEDCIGQGDSATNASFNVTYDLSTNPATASSGDNSRINASDDYFDFGTCAWLDEQNECVKNANNYLHTEDPKDDCREFSGQNKLICLTDNKPPTTTVLWKTGNTPTYGPSEFARLSFSVKDDTYSSERLTTYFSFHTTTLFDYPAYTMNDLQANDNELLNELLTGLSNENSITISYFSKDPANNLERIRSKTIQIDKDAPKISINYDVMPLSLGEDVDAYVSDIKATLTSSQSAHCTLTLLDNFAHRVQSANDKEAFETTLLKTTYVNLPDGTYTLVGYCVDENGNEATKEKEIIVEGDLSITAIHPSGEVYTSDDLKDETFSLRTANPAECFVSKSRFTANTAGDKLTASDNKLFHEIEYEDISSAPGSSGSYSLYVKCTFTETEEVVQNKPSDMFTFTIDDEAPATALYKQEPYGTDNLVLYQETGEMWEEQKFFKIQCSDANALTPFVSPTCKKIHYCLTKNLLTSITPSNFADKCDAKQQPGTFFDMSIQNTAEDMDLYGQKYIYYYGEDAQGNKEETVHRANLRITSTIFTQPNLDIS